MVYTKLDIPLRWLDRLDHDTLYFFRHRVFYSARVKLSLGHCIALLVVFVTEKVLFPTVRMFRDIVVMEFRQMNF